MRVVLKHLLLFYYLDLERIFWLVETFILISSKDDNICLWFGPSHFSQCLHYQLNGLSPILVYNSIEADKYLRLLCQIMLFEWKKKKK